MCGAAGIAVHGSWAARHVCKSAGGFQAATTLIGVYQSQLGRAGSQQLLEQCIAAVACARRQRRRRSTLRQQRSSWWQQCSSYASAAAAVEAMQQAAARRSARALAGVRWCGASEHAPHAAAAGWLAHGCSQGCCSCKLPRWSHWHSSWRYHSSLTPPPSPFLRRLPPVAPTSRAEMHIRPLKHHKIAHRTNTDSVCSRPHFGQSATQHRQPIH